MYGALSSVWVLLGCMVPFRVYGALYGVGGPLECRGPLECMGPFRVYGAFQTVWGPSECMGPFRVYGVL